MPFWCFIVVQIVGTLCVSLGGAVSAVALPSSLFGIERVGWRASLRVGASIVSCSVCTIGFWFAAGAGPGPVFAGLVICNACVVALLVLGLFKRVGRVRWGRAIAATVLFLLLQAAAATGLAYAWTSVIAKTLAVSTRSMSPTLEIGDRIVVDRFLPPRRWDMVAFCPPHEPGEVYAKRLIGLPGETVEIVNGEITIDGHVIERPAELRWLRYDATRRGVPPVCRGGKGMPMTLGPGECYVLGDNTRESLDSRYFPQGRDQSVQAGAVPKRSIMGVVRATYAPAGRMRAFR